MESLTCGTALVGIGGTLLGVFIAYRLSLNAARLQCRRIAGAKLRGAFAPEIAKYYLLMNKDNRQSKMMTDMFEEALPKHAAAIEEYRCFVPRKSEGTYQEAWENYYRNFLDYYDEGDGEQTIFKHRIDAIFNFTII